MKQADQLQQPWTLSFRASAKRFNFNFHFNYSKILPICKLFRLSIRFKIRPFTFELESKPQSAFSFNRNLKFIGKLFRKRSGNNGIAKSWLNRENYWFARRKRRRNWGWIRVLLLAVVILVLLRFYFRTRIFWNFLWMIWNYASPSGLLHHFFQVIFAGFSGYH